MKYYQQFIALLITTIFVFVTTAKGQDEIYTNAIPGDSLKPGKTLTTQDTVFFNPSLKPTISETYSVNNIINFSINEASGALLPDSFEVTLNLRIIYTDKNNLKDSISTLALTINYNKNKTYSNRAITTFQNAYWVQAKVPSIDAQYASLSAIQTNLQLENDIDVNRLYQMDCIANAIQSIDDSASTVSADGELKVYWSPGRVAQLYDLEWAWADSSALAAGYYNTNGEPDPDLIFKNNATRVTVAGNSYMIPLLYDGSGSVFFRVRATQTFPNGQINATSWSSDFISSGGLGRFDFTGHERSYNWQASTSFAEGGKRKSVVQYFDGSLRSRQTVTKDNTTNTTVVAETFYDKQGRPAIQVLPAPTLNTIINYTALFNVNSINNAEYDKSYYDTLISASDYCSAIIPSMSTVSGTSNYYSSANPLVNQAYNQFIPNGNRYPFSQTQYTQDNTGRIYRQGGVDSIFQIGLGHETKYYYGAPSQRDLDALFGTEAGDASHYQKNMVRDANGQYSVSYVDMNGKTIATALAGTPPANLKQLPSFWTATQTDDLLSPSNNIIAGNSIQSTNSLLVTIAGPYTFNYKMASDALTIEDCNQKNICYDCLYNLNITITDNCNNQLLGGNPIVINKQNFQLFKVDTSCGLVVPMDTSISIANLPEGEYNVTKTLTISKYGMHYYHDSLFMPHNTCTNYEEVLSQEMALIATEISCNQPTENTPSYTSAMLQMLNDLSPSSGQYADTSTMVQYRDSTWTNAGFSIFNVYDAYGTSGQTYYYQYPSPVYIDENGNPDSVQNTAGKLVPPEQLSKNEFIANFKDSWALSLLKFHPEYCLLKYYDTLAVSLKWDEDFDGTDTYASALAKGYLNPTGNSSKSPASRFTIAESDPLFSSTVVDIATGITVGQEAKTALEKSLFSTPVPSGGNFSSINLWSLATISGKCQGNNTQSCPAIYSLAENAFNTDSLCTADLDMAWRAFKSFYKNAKAAWIDQYIRSQCGNPKIAAPHTAVFQQADAVLADAGYTEPSADSDPANSYYTEAAHVRDSVYRATCTGYAQAWWYQLGPCDYTRADSIAIMPRLVNVCVLGTDSLHPLGSASIAPGASYQYESFNDVITQYNDSAYGTDKNNVSCNAFTIRQPLPYEQSTLATGLPIWSKPDSCECSTINKYYAKYQLVSAFYSNFSDYMQQTAGTSMSESDLDTLRSRCNSVHSCKNLTSAINLPPVFQCGSSSVCAGCSQVQKWFTAFQQQFPEAVPTYVEIDSNQRNVNLLFANYMNYQSGFGFSAQDYLTFMDTCSASVSANGSCASSKWTVFSPGTNLDINADLLMNANDNLLPILQFFSPGLFIAPTSTQTSHYVLVDKLDSVATTDSLAIMQWRVKAASKTDNVDPVIQTGGNTYVGAKWAKDPADTNWLIGTTQVKVSNGQLKGIGLQSNSFGLQADWVKLTGYSDGAELFFSDFSQSANCSSNPYSGPMLCGKPAPTRLAIADLQTDPCADSTNFGIAASTLVYDSYKDSLSDYFYMAYSKKCLDAINLESFTVTHPVSEYHYTLYYYDQAGNLVKTIPPQGVHPNRETAWTEEVKAARAAGTVLVPAHSMATIYRYK